MIQERTAPPMVRGLDAALGGVQGTQALIDRHRSAVGVNTQGGDLGHHASPSLVLRHTVNYLLAGAIAADIKGSGPLLDVGSGVGVFSSWLARRLGRPLHLADHDPAVLRLAQRAFPDVTVHDDLDWAPDAAVVTAMEVIEHIDYPEQTAFVRALMAHVEPGGVLICSTPDEHRYLGGWSGYRPHVGTLDYSGLQTLLHSATGLPVHVWRIDGPGFGLSRLQRLGEPLANRMWGMAQHRMPAATGRVAGRIGRRRRAGGTFSPAPAEQDYIVAADADGTGTGLLGAVFAPHASSSA